MKILNEVFDKVFVLTTPYFEQRIQNMKERLEGCEYEFFIGAYGGDIDVQKYRNLGSRLTRGQLACALSHYQICAKIVEENLNNVLILEDDCGFHETVNNLPEYYSQLPNNYGIFFLGYDCPSSNPYSSLLTEVGSGNVGYTHSMNMTRSCAEMVLEVNKDLLWTADGVSAEVLNRYDTKFYLANPKITYQDNDGTTSTLVEVDIKHGMGL
jgi:GR25 family glycosyltransferase involved in LPS biosynthesis